MSSEKKKILVQCDFDGTVTTHDISFMLLDTFAKGNWRKWLKQYQAGTISVGRFNEEAFSLVEPNRKALENVAQKASRIRDGFQDLVALCRQKGFRLVVVSNGLDFYVKAILNELKMDDIEAHAAQTTFRPDKIEVHYVGPDGKYLDENFKGAWTDHFLSQGYRIVYIGNGSSDFAPAEKSQIVFATESLLEHCQVAKLTCTPFTDFRVVVELLETL